MSESTFPERVQEDQITAKFIYHGEKASHYRDPEGRLRTHRADHWTAVLFRPDNETWQNGRLVDGAHRLGGSEGEIGHTIVLNWESGIGNRKPKRKGAEPEPVRPNIAEMLSMYCQEAHGVENEVTFENWFEDNKSEMDQEPTLAALRDWEALCRYRDELKRFLGSLFDEYINHTEWM